MKKFVLKNVAEDFKEQIEVQLFKFILYYLGLDIDQGKFPILFLVLFEESLNLIHTWPSASLIRGKTTV